MRMRWARTSVVAAVAIAAFLGSLVNVQPAAAAPLPQRPNIVVFMLDDLDALTMPYWDAMPKTRARLRDRGRTFRNHFSTAPLSAPSRAGILTGQYGHNNHVLSNAGAWGGYSAFLADGNRGRTFGRYLDDAGYRTMHAGKYVPGFSTFGEPVPPGWDEWYASDDFQMYYGYDYQLNANGVHRTYGDRPADYLTDVLAEISADFVTRTTTDHPDDPFLMYVNTPAPHLPMEPAVRHANHPWKSAKIPKRPNYYEADVSDKGAWLQASVANRANFKPYMDIDYQHRMGSLLAADDMIAATLDSLEANDQLDKTIVLFSSDHGYALGAHHIFGKNTPYEESIQMPLVVSGPGVEVGTDVHMSLQIDLLPTILELAGVTVPADVDGRSLAPLLRGEDPPDWRDAFLAQYMVDTVPGDRTDYRHTGTYWNAPDWRAVRTTRFKLIQWWDPPDFTGWPTGVPGCCKPQLELYDLATDPYELNNLLATPAGRDRYAGVVLVLHKKMYTLAVCSGASCNRPPVTPGLGSSPVEIPRGGRP